jgi:hypothetical protein
MREILLTQNKVAVVDDEDFEYLSQFGWHARKDRHTFYAARNIMQNGKRITQGMHRLIMDAPCDMEIDHINGNGLDNRRCNLRLCTTPQNKRNSRLRKDNKSGFKGVSWNKAAQKWVSQITHNGKVIYIGSFDNTVDAAIAYNEAALTLHGEFARINNVRKMQRIGGGR